MADQTKIAWTEATWNPLRGCSMVSEGCKHCYALALAHRFRNKGYEGLTRVNGGKPVWTGEIAQIRGKLDQPLRWERPRRIFVNSTSDLFHENVPFSYIATVFGVMAAATQHTFQVLTKRPARMLAFFDWLKGQAWPDPITHDLLCGLSQFELSDGSNAGQTKQADRLRNRMYDFKWPLPNVWLGVTIENQKAADERLPLLTKAPAVVRFLSCEPLLGPVDLGDISSIAWVIVGGESGPKARPMEEEWAVSLYTQCAGHVAFFFKQLGEVWAKEAGTTTRKGDELSEFPEALQIREYPIRMELDI